MEIITDDMPFLVESVQAAAVRAGCEVQRVIHPIVVVRRTGSGELAEVLTAEDPAAPPPGTLAESWIHLDLAPAPVRPADLEAALDRVLRDVRTIVEDGAAMVDRARELADALPTEPVVAGGTRPADVADLLRWLADGHFTFIGYCYYEAAASGDSAELRPDLSTGLGALGPLSSVTATFAPARRHRRRRRRRAGHHPRERDQPAARGAPLLPGGAHHRAAAAGWSASTASSAR